MSSKETNLKREEVMEWYGGKDYFEAYHFDKHQELKEKEKLELF